MTFRTDRGVSRTNRRGAFLFRLGIASSVLIAFVLRVRTAVVLPFHVDEAASLLAIKMVVEQGYPRFPSGTLYLQGATFSYLNAPIGLLFGVGPDSVDAFRMVSATIGTLAVLVLAQLALFVTRSRLVALLAAILLALDPFSIHWSGLVRMYSLLQLFALLLCLLFFRLLANAENRKVLSAFVAIWFLAIFNHLAVLSLLPVFAGVAFLRFRLAVFTRQLGLTLSIALASLAPLVIFALNRVVHSPGEAVGGKSNEASFVGDHLIQWSTVRNPKFSEWQSLFEGLPFYHLWPLIMIAISAAVVVLSLLPGKNRGIALHWSVAITLVGAYWAPVLVMALFFTETHARYLLHVQAIGLLMIAILIGGLFQFASGGFRRIPNTTATVD